jgi:hypothetical protein
MRHVKNELPKDDVKICLGDNLAAHKSPEVMAMCEEWNIK